MRLIFNAAVRPGAIGRYRSTREFGDNAGDCGQRCAEFSLIFAAGFGDFGFASAGAADEFGDRANQFACLDAFDQSWRNAGDDGNFALRLRRAQDDYTFA